LAQVRPLPKQSKMVKKLERTLWGDMWINFEM